MTNKLVNIATNIGRRGGGHSSHDDTGSIHNVQKKTMGYRVDHLLSIAKENLRCVEWRNLSLKLFEDSKGNDRTYALSRPVREGEKIDYFISHSWHDPHDEKWNCLKKIVEKFQKSDHKSRVKKLFQICWNR